MIQLLERILKRYPVLLQFARFVAIGFITAAVDFLLLNAISKWLGITEGWKLGAVNVASFAVAVLHSYIWQRYWTFANSEVITVAKNFLRLVLFGSLGVGALVVVVLASRLHAAAFFYLLVFILVILIEVILWYAFHLANNGAIAAAPTQFAAFLVVSIIGLLINTVIVSLASTYLVGSSAGSNADLAKNIAKVAANAISLIWNFIGYKLFVFKR